MKGVMEPSSNRNNYISTWWISSRIAAVSRFRLVLMDSAGCPSSAHAEWAEVKYPGANPRRKLLGVLLIWAAHTAVSRFTHLLGFAQGAERKWERSCGVFPSLFPALGPGCSQGRSRADLSLTLGIWEKIFCTGLCFSRFSALSRIKWQFGWVFPFKSAWDTESYFHQFYRPFIL